MPLHGFIVHFFCLLKTAVFHILYEFATTHSSIYLFEDILVTSSFGQ